MSEQQIRGNVSSEDKLESVGIAVYAYQLGHIGFLDLIHQLDEILGLPPLKFNHESEAGPGDTKTT